MGGKRKSDNNKHLPGKSALAGEILGITLAVISLFVLVSLFSFNPADGPDPSVVPQNEVAANYCGTAGAHLSFYMFRYIGMLPSFAIALLVGIWGGLSVARIKFKGIAFKLLGSGVFVLSFATVERMVLPENAFRGRFTGGYFGTFLARWMTYYLGEVGAFLAVAGVLAISLLLATDLMFYDIIRQIVAKFRTLALSCRTAAGAAATATGASVKSIAVRGEPPAEVKAVGEPAVEKPVFGKKVKPEKQKKAHKKAQKKIKVRKAKEVEKAKVPEPRISAEGYRLPPLDILDAPDKAVEEYSEVVQERAEIIEGTLENFGIGAKVVEVQKGPVITQYELLLAPGVKASKIAGLSEDLAMALRAPSVRIVFPIPGKSTLGVEVPNTKRVIVRLKELLCSRAAQKDYDLPLFLGKDAAGAPIVTDLAKMPHLLIAGATGSGKSVCINSVITSILYKRTPEEVKLILIDPKMVELSMFENLPHLLHPVVTDMAKAAGVLEWATQKMDERYETLQMLSVRHIKHFNSISREERERKLAPMSEDLRETMPEKMPYIVIIIDELADLMMAGSKAVEFSITRLAQKSRAVGIHLVLATQRPSVDVITGLIKTNMPSRIAFHVSSKIDSRTILDSNGAEALLMQGDMLYLRPGASALVRAQGTFVDDSETKKIVSFIKEQAKPEFSEELVRWQPEGKGGLVVDEGVPPQEIDELYNSAVEIILSAGRGSVSLLQRKLGIGYGRASRLVDIMEYHGVVGPSQGSSPREVLMSPDQWHEMQERAQQTS